MSDGECHYVDPKTGQGCFRRYSWSDTHCQDCGKPKWLYRNRDGRPLVRRLFEVIAAFERGRQPSAEAEHKKMRREQFRQRAIDAGDPGPGFIVGGFTVSDRPRPLPDGWLKHPRHESWEKRAGTLRARVMPLWTYGADYAWGIIECDPAFPDHAELAPRQYTTIEESDTVLDEDGSKALALAEAALQRIIAQRS